MEPKEKQPTPDLETHMGQDATVRNLDVHERGAFWLDAEAERERARHFHQLRPIPDPCHRPSGWPSLLEDRGSRRSISEVLEVLLG